MPAYAPIRRQVITTVYDQGGNNPPTSIATNAQPGDLVVIFSSTDGFSSPPHIPDATIIGSNNTANLRTAFYSFTASAANQSFSILPPSIPFNQESRITHVVYRGPLGPLSVLNRKWNRIEDNYGFTDNDNAFQIVADCTLLDFLRYSGGSAGTSVSRPMGGTPLHTSGTVSVTERNFEYARPLASTLHIITPPNVQRRQTVGSIAIGYNETRNTEVELVYSGNVTAGLPDTIQNGDVILASHYNGSSYPNIPTSDARESVIPSGWTTLSADPWGTGAYFHRYTGSDVSLGFTSGYVPGSAGFYTATTLLTIWRNVHPTTPFSGFNDGDHRLSASWFGSKGGVQFVQYLSGWYQGIISPEITYINRASALPGNGGDNVYGGYYPMEASGMPPSRIVGQQGNFAQKTQTVLINPLDEPIMVGNTWIAMRLPEDDFRSTAIPTVPDDGDVPGILLGPDAKTKLGVRESNSVLVQPDAVVSTGFREDAQLIDEQRLFAPPTLCTVVRDGVGIMASPEAAIQRTWSYSDATPIYIADGSIFRTIGTSGTTTNSVMLQGAGRHRTYQDGSGDPSAIVLTESSVLSVSIAKTLIDEQLLLMSPIVTTPLPGDTRVTIFRLASAEARFHNQIATDNSVLLAESGDGGNKLHFRDPFHIHLRTNGQESIRSRITDPVPVIFHYLAAHRRSSAIESPQSIVLHANGKAVSTELYRLDWVLPSPDSTLSRSLIVCQLDFGRVVPIDAISLFDPSDTPVPHFIREINGNRLKLILQPYYTPAEKQPLFLSVRELVR
jgi:hypothetical protein